jgi:DNA-binding NarL/FixJ family response regulator
LEAESIEVVGEAADGEEGVRVALELRPDVVLMDVSMPRLDGIDATRRLVAADADMRVVMLTMHVDRDVVENALKAGAVGYVTKDASVGEVAEAIRLAANGDRPLSPHLAGALLHEARSGNDGIISTREEEVLQLVADGLGTNEIAARLYISHRTVKNHLASIYDKLDARDRTQAVLMAVKMGIVKLT